MPANNLMLMTARSRAAASTYLMARRQLLTPYLMSSVAGTWAHVSSASYLLGGALQSSTHADDDEIALLANHPIAQGTHDYRLLHNTFTTKPIFALDVNGAEEASVDQYGGSAANVVSEDSFTLGAKSAALSLRISGKNASSTDYYASAQLGEVVKTSDGDDWGSGPEDLPWYQDIPPWFYDSTSSSDASNFWAGTTSAEFGGYCRIASGSGEHTTYRLFCPATADYQLALKYVKLSSGAVLDFTLDGSPLATTLDTYNASTTYNHAATISLGSLSAGWHTVRIRSTASSPSGFNARLQWLQLQRTTTGTCPAGVNGPEQVLLLPVFSDSESGTWGVALDAGQGLYGFLFTNSGAGAHKTWAANLRAGTYRARIHGVRWSDGATIAVKIDGTTEGTADMSGANTYNHIFDVTGIEISDGKNTVRIEQTGGTYIRITSILLERTGD